MRFFLKFLKFLVVFVSFFDNFENQETKPYSPLKKNYSLILLGLFLCIQNTFGQNQNEIQTYNWFDSAIGKESLEYSAGTAHLNFDSTIDNQHRYYKLDQFKNGNITYNNQSYYNLDLKYDIFTDELIIRPYPENSRIQINLVKEKMNSFMIENEKFVNLKDLNTTYKSGYYEENIIGDNCILYIKYIKAKKSIIEGTSSLISYTPYCEFLLLKENKFILINSKSEIIKLYPKQKRRIDDFYSINKGLKKESPGLFMKNLMKYINNFNL